MCSCLSANCSTENSCGSELRQHTACDGNLDETFTRLSQNKELLILPHASLSLFFFCVCMCMCMCVCLGVCVAVSDLAALQTSTDVSRGAVGSHSIEEAPGSSDAFSLPLGSVRAAQQNLPPTLVLPPGPSLRQNYKGPPTAGSSLCSPSFSHPPLPSLPPLAADTAFTAGKL